MTPVAKKLQIKPCSRWLFYNVPDNYPALIDPMPDGVKFSTEPDGDFDGIQLFVLNSEAISSGLEMVVPLLKHETIFWITYPKKSSGINSGLEMMGNWDVATKFGLRIVTSVSIDQTWTALRFRFNGLSKLSASRNAEIENHEYGSYIDVENKQVRLSDDMLQALERSVNAFQFFSSLSYSNKKEYVVWILSAKQEKTRATRLDKLVEKLLNKKKNPAEK